MCEDFNSYFYVMFLTATLLCMVLAGTPTCADWWWREKPHHNKLSLISGATDVSIIISMLIFLAVGLYAFPWGTWGDIGY